MFGCRRVVVFAISRYPTFHQASASNLQGQRKSARRTSCEGELMTEHYLGLMWFVDVFGQGMGVCEQDEILNSATAEICRIGTSWKAVEWHWKELQSPGKMTLKDSDSYPKIWSACWVWFGFLRTFFDLVTWYLPTGFHVSHVCFSMRLPDKETDATCQGACWKRGWGCKGLQMSCCLASLLPDEPSGGHNWMMLYWGLFGGCSFLVPYEIWIEMN